MYEIIGTNFAWVSPEGFFEFCKIVSTLDNLDSFTNTDLIKKYSTVTAHHKVRSNLEYATSLGVITRINGHYKIEDIIFFQLLKDGNKNEALKHIKIRIEQHPFFQKILTEFFYDKKTKTIKELREFIKTIDNDNHKARYYHKGCKFFAKFLDKLRLLEYNQRRQTITTRNEKLTLQKKLIETPKISIQTKNSFQEILNEVIDYMKSIDNKNELAKLISIMPERDRIKITEKLLENINNP